MPVPHTAVLAAILACGCGRFGFEDSGAPDASAPTTDTPVQSDASSSADRFLGGFVGRSPGDANLDVAIAPSDADLYVVGVTNWSGRSVVGITDTAGGTYRPVFDRAGNPDGTASELWYANGVRPATSVTVQMSTDGTEGFDVWVGLFTGVDPSPLAQYGGGCNRYPPDIQAVPLIADAGTIVVVTTMLQNPIYTDAVAAPFKDIGDHTDGNGAAYFIVDTPGTYSPIWHISSGEGISATTCSSGAAFPPLH
ncbi:MAG TPA: hypothetical protein VGM90_01210 [Kofleriaceae bacterium]